MIIGCLHYCSRIDPGVVRTDIRLLPVCRRRSHGCHASASRRAGPRARAGGWATLRCGTGRAVPRTTRMPGSMSLPILDQDPIHPPW